jgi:hypothetical protein
MDHLGDAYRTLGDPLNEPPPPVRNRRSGESALGELLAELSAGPDGWRIERMIEDQNWLEGLARARGISIG